MVQSYGASYDRVYFLAMDELNIVVLKTHFHPLTVTHVFSHRANPPVFQAQCLGFGYVHKVYADPDIDIAFIAH